MPELPEVETTTRGLQRVLPGLVIKDVWSDYHIKTAHGHKQTIKNKKYSEDFRKRLSGRKIISARRRGKNILIEISSGDVILTHMKMTGHYLYGDYVYDKKKNKWEPQGSEALADPYNRFIHLVLKLSNGKCLALSDTRKFAKVIIIGKEDFPNHPDISILGPEPLEKTFNFKKFKERILLKDGPIKSVLMNQEIIAGIGNIYSDEVLWRVGIHPESKSAKLNDKQFAGILREIKKILNESIKIGGDSASDYRNINGEKGNFQKRHEVYKRKNMKCSKKGCRGIVRRIVVRGRSSHFCDTHQKKLI